MPPSADAAPPSVRGYVYKTLSYRYWGRDYRFYSSRELFSAAQIDRGSQLLLSSLLPDDRGKGVLKRLLAAALSCPHACVAVDDWGCGIGPLGVMAQGHLGQLYAKYLQHTLQHTQPPAAPRSLACALRLFDRDALALEFARSNWEANRNALTGGGESGSGGYFPTLEVRTGIWGEESLRPAAADLPAGDGPHLVLSNIPAKLGEPVLRRILPALAATPSTYVAIVIVAPLRRFVEEAAERGILELLHRCGSGDHCVLHYRQGPKWNGSRDTSDRSAFGYPCTLEGDIIEDKDPSDPSALPHPLRLYRRGRAGFVWRGGSLQPYLPEEDTELRGCHWAFDAAYGLPDFDRPGHSLQLLLTALGRKNGGRRALLWQPGHGHAACFLVRKWGLRQLDLAGRDRLALLFAQHNVENHSGLRHSVSTEIYHLPYIEALPQGTDWGLVVLPIDDPGEGGSDPAVAAWLSALPAGTLLCLLGRRNRLSGPQFLPRLLPSSAWNGPSVTGISLHSHGWGVQVWRRK
ncbi:MAG: hypothetical protein AAF975_03760 [Spirochaetota bacterium]